MLISEVRIGDLVAIEKDNSGVRESTGDVGYISGLMRNNIGEIIVKVKIATPTSPGALGVSEEIEMALHPALLVPLTQGNYRLSRDAFVERNPEYRVVG